MSKSVQYQLSHAQAGVPVRCAVRGTRVRRTHTHKKITLITYMEYAHKYRSASDHDRRQTQSPESRPPPCACPRATAETRRDSDTRPRHLHTSHDAYDHQSELRPPRRRAVRSPHTAELPDPESRAQSAESQRGTRRSTRTRVCRGPNSQPHTRTQSPCVMLSYLTPETCYKTASRVCCVQQKSKL